MFGCCISGRLPQTNLNQIDETHVTFLIPNAAAVGHIVVFLLGTIPFPPGYAATIHFEWPGKGFQLLGMLSNEKPSAIFRLRGTWADSQSNSMVLASQIAPGADVVATLGISIEPVEAVQAQVAALPSATAAGQAQAASTNPTILAERIVRHLFNHLSSFETNIGSQTLVPLAVIQKWYDNLQAKLRAGGAGFLMKDD